MKTFTGFLKKHGIKSGVLKRQELSTLQVNMGNLCNQNCSHCHIGASPAGTRIMQQKVIDDVLKFLKSNDVKTLDITGGAPELNPGFAYLVESGRPLVDELIVRSNLTVIFEKGKEDLPEFFKKNRAYLICSLPCYTEENVDKQRGKDVFKKSIAGLKILNAAGFSRDPGLQLDLVYNSLGAYLPGDQKSLEKDYKQELESRHGIHFNNLLTITNVPINKFKNQLVSNGEYEHYIQLLENSFNPGNLDKLMCRTFLSVGYDGSLYDCDFNLALGLSLKDAEDGCLTIGGLKLQDLTGKEIITGDHCLACTAGSGSSCKGALTNEKILIPNKPGGDEKKVVREYYGKTLKSSRDLKTSACCSIESLPKPIDSIINNIEPEIIDKIPDSWRFSHELLDSLFI